MWADKIDYYEVSAQVEPLGSPEITSLRFRIARWIWQRLLQQNSLDAKKQALEYIDDMLELVTLCEELRREMDRRGLSYIPDHVDGNPYAWFQHNVYQYFRKKPSTPRTKKIIVSGKTYYVWKIFKYKRRSFIRFASFMLEAIERDERLQTSFYL